MHGGIRRLLPFLELEKLIIEPVLFFKKALRGINTRLKERQLLRSQVFEVFPNFLLFPLIAFDMLMSFLFEEGNIGFCSRVNFSEFIIREREFGVPVVLEQLWESFDNCSYRRSIVMEGKPQSEPIQSGFLPQFLFITMTCTRARIPSWEEQNVF